MNRRSRLPRDLRGRIDVCELSTALRHARAFRAMSLRQAAEDSGISASTLSRVECGEGPSLDTMRALASWLGVDLVVSGDGETP